MRVSKVKGIVAVLSLAISLAGAGRTAAQCRICDPFFHCVDSHPGALVCIESPAICSMLMPCLGGGRSFDDAATGDDLTTWTLFDAGPAAGTARVSLRAGAGALALGEEARAGAGGAGSGGSLADVALAHGRDYAITLVDAAGDGFALRRRVEGARVRIEVRDVRADVTGAMLASELLGERDQLSVPVRVAGRDRVLVLQASSVHGGSAGFELARLRRAMLAAGRSLPQRREPLLKARAQ